MSILIYLFIYLICNESFAAPCANTQFVPPTHLFMECLNRVLCIQQPYTIPQLEALEEKKTQ